MIKWKVIRNIKRNGKNEEEEKKKKSVDYKSEKARACGDLDTKQHYFRGVFHMAVRVALKSPLVAVKPVELKHQENRATYSANKTIKYHRTSAAFPGVFRIISNYQHLSFVTQILRAEFLLLILISSFFFCSFITTNVGQRLKFGRRTFEVDETRLAVITVYFSLRILRHDIMHAHCAASSKIILRSAKCACVYRRGTHRRFLAWVSYNLVSPKFIV